MRLALLEEKVDFVDLLLTSGFVMSSFLTVVELRNLYNLTVGSMHILGLFINLISEDRVRTLSTGSHILHTFHVMLFFVMVHTFLFH